MSRQQTEIIPREYSAVLRQSSREYAASVSDGFVETPPTLTIDDFEDGDTSEYDDPDGILSAQQTVVHEGSWAGKIDNQSGAVATAISQLGLDNYPARGDAFRVYMRADNQGLTCTFGAVDTENFYYISLDSSGSVGLAKLSGNSPSILDSASFSYSGGFVPIVPDFDSAGDGTISVDVANGAATLSAQDNEYDGTGFGWGAADGAVGYVDSAEII